jgi:predicted DNA-binding protein YlxM (UPF0122 family)
MILSVSEFAEAVGVVRQSVYDAIKTGSVVKSGKKIDTDDKVNQIYIRSSHERKSAFDHFSKKDTAVPVSEKKTLAKLKKADEQSDFVPDTARVINESSEFGDISHIPTEDVIRKTQFAKLLREQENVISKKFENQRTRDQWCDRKTVMAIVPSFISKIHSGMKMVGETFLSDLGVKHGIVFANEDYKMLQDAVIEMTNMAIEQVQIDIKNENL